jgi:transposase InsO family protein
MGRKKKEMICELSAKYSVETLCELFDFPRSSFYYRKKVKFRDCRFDDIIQKIFNDNYHSYGSRKIRVELEKEGIYLSRHRIREVMIYQGLVSKYVLARKPKNIVGCNYVNYQNLVRRFFKHRRPFEVVAGDVTYVYFGRKRYYLCILIDIATRMIVGWSVSTVLDADLVEKAMRSMELDLSKVTIFHTDRGGEFNNVKINGLLKSYDILRSLSAVAAPLDNAVVESINNIVKIEWKYDREINNTSEFDASWSEYVYWYNNRRVHGSLGYKTPAEFYLSFAKAS